MSGKDIGRKRIPIYPAQRMNHKILLHFSFLFFLVYRMGDLAAIV